MVSISVAVAALFAAVPAVAAEADWVELGAELHAVTGQLRGFTKLREFEIVPAMKGYSGALLAAYEKHIGKNLGEQALSDALNRLRRDEKEPLAYERKAILLQGLATAMNVFTDQKHSVSDRQTLSVSALLSAMNSTSGKLPELMAEHGQLYTKPGQLSTKEADRLSDVKAKMGQLRSSSLKSAVLDAGSLYSGTMPKAPQRSQPGLVGRLFGKH
jgi:hypothetical protein